MLNTPKLNFDCLMNTKEHNIDALILSCAIYRLNSSGIYYSLDDIKNDQVIDEDRLLAKKIRNYYGSKLVMSSLKNQSMSSFRKDLAGFLCTDGTKYDLAIAGIIYKLPEFYEYDQTLELLNYTKFAPIYADDDKNFECGEFNIVPVTKLMRNTKIKKSIQYWFVVEKNNHPLCISIEPKNPLLHIWEKLFSHNKVLKIKGTFIINKGVGFKYYDASKWNLEEFSIIT